MKHSEISARHTDASEACGGLQECFVGMGKEAGAGVQGTMYRKVASHFGKLKQAHGDLADLHDDAEKIDQGDRDKAIEDKVEAVLGKTLRPDSFTSVASTDAPGFGITAGIRAIPRAGQPEFAKAAENVPVQFRHLIENLNLQDEI